MAVTGVFQADFTQWDRALQNAKANLKSFEVPVKGLQSQLTNMTKGFSGERIIREAKLMSAAIEKVGGVTKLTASEQKRANTTVTEAIAKYKALGQQAPEALNKLQRETKQATSALGGMSSILGGMKGLLAGAFAGVSISFLVRDVIGLASNLKDLSAKTGIGVKALQELQFAGKQVGVSMEAIGAAVGQMQKRIAGGDASAEGALKKLGLSIATFRALRPEEQFQAVADKIAGIADPAARAKLAMDVMGRGALEVMPLLVGGLGELRAEAQRLGIVLSDQTVDNLDNLGDSLDTLTLAGKAALANALVPMVPALRDVAKVAIEAAKVIGGMGEALRAAQIGFQHGLSVMFRWAASITDVGVAVLKLQKTLDPISNITGKVDERIRQFTQDAQDLRAVSKDLADDALKQAWQQLYGVEQSARKAAPAVVDVGKAASGSAKQMRDMSQAADQQRSALQALGIVTEKQVNKAMSEYAALEKLAVAEGVPLDRVLAALYPKYAELAKQAAASGVSLDRVSAAIERTLGPIRQAVEAMEDWERANIGTTASLDAIIRSLPEYSVEAEGASLETALLSDALKHAGETGQKELPKISQAASRIADVVKHVQEAVGGAFAQMLIGAKGFKDGFIDIWNSIKAGILNILNAILSSFINTFLKGLLGALTGQKGAFQGAFAGLFGGGGGAPGGGLLGGLLGKIPGLGGIFGPASGTQLALPGLGGVAGGAAAAGGAGASGSQLALPGLAGGGGILSGILGGAGAAGGGALLGLLGKELFGGKGAAAGAFGGATGALQGALIGSIVPGIGTAIGALIGGLSGVISGIFGGPSKAQKEARQTVADFTATIRSGLNADQIAEAAESARKAGTATSEWAQDIIAVRDAYLKAGLSAEEALKDVERLWASAKDGGPTTAAVIQEIIAKMNQVAGATDNAAAAQEELSEAAKKAALETITSFARTYQKGSSYADQLRRDWITDLSAIQDYADQLRYPEWNDRPLPSPTEPIPMAGGGSGTVTKPTLFLVGEKGREDFAFSGANRGFTGGSDLRELIAEVQALRQEVRASRRVSLTLDGRQIAEADVRATAANIGGIRTRKREALGVA